jgi:hypothetical protein
MAIERLTREDNHRLVSLNGVIRCLSAMKKSNILDKLTQFDPQILISDVYDGRIKY